MVIIHILVQVFAGVFHGKQVAVKKMNFETLALQPGTNNLHKYLIFQNNKHH